MCYYDLIKMTINGLPQEDIAILTEMIKEMKTDNIRLVNNTKIAFSNINENSKRIENK